MYWIEVIVFQHLYFTTIRDAIKSEIKGLWYFPMYKMFNKIW